MTFKFFYCSNNEPSVFFWFVYREFSLKCWCVDLVLNQNNIVNAWIKKTWGKRLLKLISLKQKRNFTDSIKCFLCSCKSYIYNMTFYTEISYTRYDRYTHLLAFSFRILLQCNCQDQLHWKVRSFFVFFSNFFVVHVFYKKFKKMIF